MRKLFLAAAAAAAIGLAIPATMTTSAEAQNTTVVVKKKPGKHVYRGNRKVTVIKTSNRRAYHSHARATKVVIKKKRPAARVTVRTN